MNRFSHFLKEKCHKHLLVPDEMYGFAAFLWVLEFWTVGHFCHFGLQEIVMRVVDIL